MPTDRSRTGRKPVLKRITERVASSAQPLLAEFQRQEPALGIIHGENADTGASNPFEAEQFPVSMPKNHARIISNRNRGCAELMASAIPYGLLGMMSLARLRETPTRRQRPALSLLRAERAR